MAKVLRLHKSGDNNIEDWQQSTEIGIDQINDIQDPEDATSNKEITSIPSPFARIDLVRTAFNEIVDNPRYDLDGKTIYHKMISDSFDVGEILFNIKRYKDKFEIIYWDKSAHINELLNSDIEEHRAVGKTLKMYMEQDSTAYNFDQLERIYLLNYIGPDKPAQMNIVGATSPCTLFFSSANDLSYISKHVSFGNDRPFDGILFPLYKRDFEYIKYLWLFRANYQGFARDFRCIDEYMQLTYSKLTFEQKEILDSIDANVINEYDSIDIIDINNNVEILNHPYHQRPSSIVTSSDFEINTTVYDGRKPLVLPIESGNTYTSLKYTHKEWTNRDKAPAYDKVNWLDRKLPITGDECPYLTISDFLTDTIVKSPFALNTKNFFSGNATASTGSYLLPITETFFDFFTVEELMGEIKDTNKKMFELKENAGGVTATIRIPIKGNSSVRYIEYQRSYYESNTPDKASNKGSLITKRFGMGLFPCLKFKDGVDPHYRIPLFDKGFKDISLSFYDGGRFIELSDNELVNRREKDIENGICSIETYVVNSNFDRVKFNIGGIDAFVIPRLKPLSGSAKYTFAIDFGTSNTHIEYSKDNSAPMSFDITNEEQQMIRLHVDYLGDPDIDYGFVENNVPETIGDGSLYKFPMRTAFAEYNEINYQTTTHTLASGNVAFRYEKAATPAHNTMNTDLKWSTEKKEQVSLFLANIYLLIRNKVIMGKGDLSATKIVWFYPASMTEAHCNKFKKIWTQLYQEYIGDDLGNVITMSESVAPYNFYSKKRGAKSNVVTIDIGGGTTDVYAVENSKPVMLSSFRFAANAIFGDGYSWESDQNGFIKLFRDSFVKSLEENKFNNEIEALKFIEDTKISSDIIALFFAMSQNQRVIKDKINSLKFLELLENNQQIKYVFIIFYTAITYYIARLMKAKGLQMPLTIAFSGNGSKTLRVLSSDKATLAKFIKLIFEKVYDEKYLITNDLEVIYEENPKEATCKGGILAPNNQDFDGIENLKCSLLGVDKQTLINQGTATSIDETAQANVVKEVEEFIEFMFALDKDNGNFFKNKFDVDTKIAVKVKEMCRLNLLEYISKGVSNQIEESKGWQDEEEENHITETLFFLPIVGMLNNVAREIANIK